MSNCFVFSLYKIAHILVFILYKFRFNDYLYYVVKLIRRQ